VAAIIASTSIVAISVGSTPVQAASGEPDEVVALLVEGVGNGHGRGMSQWGAYGRAVNGGQTWQQILDAYYGGTVLGDAPDDQASVRLVGFDGVSTLGVMSTASNLRWNNDTTNYRSLYAQHVSGSTYRLFGSSSQACPGAAALVVPDGPLARGASGDAVSQLQRVLDRFGYSVGPIDGSFGNLTETAVRSFQSDENLTQTGIWNSVEATRARTRLATMTGSVSWTDLGTTTGPVRFTSTVNQSSSAASAVIGVCSPSGTVTHYRGFVELLRDTQGNHRTVNTVTIENYLRGVVPREVSASWGSAGDGRGMHALRAQAVAARSYALSQNRYSYAKTCDTTACQAYGGAARRSSATAGPSVLEHPLTDQAIADTAGKVRRRSNGSLVSTEYSASNGPRTAGGAFPAIDDPLDDVAANPNHRWTRIIDARSVANRYGTGTLTVSATEPDPGLTAQGISGIWASRVRLTGSSKNITVDAWSFRGAYGLPSPGYTVRAITRDVVSNDSFALIGDSVGASVTSVSGAPLPVLLDGVFASTRYDAVASRCTVGTCIGGNDGVRAARNVPQGTDLVVVQLGYNDATLDAPKIDQVMSELRSRGVGTVAWVNLSERRTSRGYGAHNAALSAAASRWNELLVLDWNAASSGAQRNRWFSDDVHLTTTGRAEFSQWLRERIVELANGAPRPRQVVPSSPLRVKVAGVAGVPAAGEVSAVSLNVTATGAGRRGFVTVWPCGSPRPVASNLNFLPGQSVANAVLAPVDATGEVCLYAHDAVDLVVDVSGWFVRAGDGSGLSTRVPERIVDTRIGLGPIPGR
jgi:peptidoglycan hydrolase-like amidase